MVLKRGQDYHCCGEDDLDEGHQSEEEAENHAPELTIPKNESKIAARRECPNKAYNLIIRITADKTILKIGGQVEVASTHYARILGLYPQTRD